MSQYNTTNIRQRGFSLIEALVAFLILSIGMLGIGSLQLISLKAGHTAALRTVAVIKVEEIMERIRTNPEEVMSYVSDTEDAGDATKNCNNQDATAAIGVCNAVEMAKDDVAAWKADLTTSLPNNTNTKASIAVVAAVPGTQPTAEVTVTINWQERNPDWQEGDPETNKMLNMSYNVSSHICVSASC